MSAGVPVPAFSPRQIASDAIESAHPPVAMPPDSSASTPIHRFSSYTGKEEAVAGDKANHPQLSF